MPTYTPEQRTHAITLANEHGIPHASQALGIHPHTIRKWARTITVPDTPPPPYESRATVAERGRQTAAAEAGEARQSRVKVAQQRLADLVMRAGDVSADAALLLAATLVELHQVETDAIADSAAARIAGDPESQARADISWRRVRALSDTLLVQARAYGIAVDKLARLGGEDSPVPAAPPATTINLGVLLEQDPGLRADVVAGTRERIAAARSIVVDVPAVEA